MNFAFEGEFQRMSSPLVELILRYTGKQFFNASAEHASDRIFSLKNSNIRVMPMYDACVRREQMQWKVMRIRICARHLKVTTEKTWMGAVHCRAAIGDRSA